MEKSYFTLPILLDYRYFTLRPEQKLLPSNRMGRVEEGSCVPCRRASRVGDGKCTQDNFRLVGLSKKTPTAVDKKKCPY